MSTNFEDGGYYAIKGFLFQFDKSLIEILSDPATVFELETIEDLNCQDYVIQIKHRETQEFAFSKIKKAVSQLLNLFSDCQPRAFKICLYCHFKDKIPSEWQLTLEELDRILGNDKELYPADAKEQFLQSFIVQFSEDYEEQFQKLLDLIRTSFTLADRELAIIYHSIFRSNLLDLVAQTSKGQRQIKRADLEGYVSKAEKTIFYKAYSTYIKQEKYESAIKKIYFTFKSVNLENFERLFIVDYDGKSNIVSLMKIVDRIANKYFKLNKSPAPYICFRGIEDSTLNTLKQRLVDVGIVFTDGTHFNGDKFRLDTIGENASKENRIKVKIVNPLNLDEIAQHTHFDEIYMFYLDLPLHVGNCPQQTKIQVVDTEQISRIF